jgi:hypothetical protein
MRPFVSFETGSDMGLLGASMRAIVIDEERKERSDNYAHRVHNCARKCFVYTSRSLVVVNVRGCVCLLA